MSNQETQFKNTNIAVNVEKYPDSKVTFHIIVSPEATKIAHKSAIKSVSKEVSIPGFRKGKAPESFITEKFGSHVTDEWKLTCVNTSLNEAFKLTEIYPLSDKSVSSPKVHSISNEEGTNFTVDFEAYPIVPIINPSDIQIYTVKPVPVTQEDIEERIHDVLLSSATWDDINDRPLKHGDFATLHIESADNPDLVLCDNQRFEMTEKRMKWLFKVLLGKTAGDVVEAISEKEEKEKDSCQACDDPTQDHHHHHEEEFKPTNCKITLTAVQAAVLPELNDETVKKMGAESVEIFRQRVEETLKRDAQDKADHEMKQQIDGQLVKLYPFDLPISIVRKQIRDAVQHEVGNLYLRKLSAEEIKEHSAKIEHDVKETITNAYKAHFIKLKLEETLELEISQEEIMQEFMKQVYMMQGQGYVKPTDDAAAIRSQIVEHLMKEKVQNHLLEHATKK